MKRKKGSFTIVLGLLLIAAALFLWGYNMYQAYRAGLAARQVISRFEESTFTESKTEKAESAGQNAPADSLAPEAVAELPDYILHPDMEMPVETIDGIDYIGVLRIPSLELELPVISQWSYSKLMTAPCRYSGSAYSGDLIICGHNFLSHFGNLYNLREGDPATFTDMDGNVFTYKMVEREMMQPTDLEEMARGEWDLTLFTCTVGGQSRLTIRFERETDKILQ